jgi:hypothetical protein
MENQNPTPEETQQFKIFLTPLAAVQTVWGYTVEFSRKESINLIDFTQKVLTQFCGKGEAAGKNQSNANTANQPPGAQLPDKTKGCVLKLSEDEKRYLYRVLAAMECALRCLHVLYQGRNHNWQEIEKLHEVYLESLKNTVTFGEKFKDIFRALPAMALGSAGGITLVEAFKTTPISKLWLVGLLFAALGYFVDLFVVKWSNKRKRRNYIRLDYERTCYYKDYLTRIYPVLIHLYDSVKEIYEEIFDPPYKNDTQIQNERNWIEKMVNQLEPQLCEFIDIHMESNKITPELWPCCETGKVEGCPLA